MNKRWLVKEKPQTEKISELSSALGVEPVLACILIQRELIPTKVQKHFSDRNLKNCMILF